MTEKTPPSPDLPPSRAIGARLAAHRDRLCLTNAELAVYLGASRQAVRHWLTDARQPSGLLVRLLDVLDIVHTLAPAIGAQLVEDCHD